MSLYVSTVHSSKLDEVIDSEHGGAPIHLGQIADSMEARLEGMAPVLGLSNTETSEIMASHPTLRHQMLVSHWHTLLDIAHGLLPGFRAE